MNELRFPFALILWIAALIGFMLSVTVLAARDKWIWVPYAVIFCFIAGILIMREEK